MLEAPNLRLGAPLADLPLHFYLILPLVSFVAGVVDAIAGGGGLLTLPALLATGIPSHLSLGTNKAQAIWGAIGATWKFWRGGQIDRRRALTSFLAGAAGSGIGASAVLLVDPRSLRWVIVVLLAAVGVFMAVYRPPAPAASESGAPVQPKVPTRRRSLIAVALSVLIGAYDGFFGPGTGTLLIVAFAGVLHEPLVNASANAKVVNLASNAAALTAFAIGGKVLWLVALPMAVAQLIGGYVGAGIAVAGGHRMIRLATLSVVAALIAKIVWDSVAG